MRRNPPIWVVAAAVVAITVLGAATGVGLAVVQPDVWQAEAQILFPTAEAETGAEAERMMATQQTLVRTPARVRAVAAEIGMEFDALREALTIDVLNEGDVLRVAVTSVDADLARRAVEGIATDYVEEITSRDTAGEERLRALLDDRIAELTSAIEDVQTRLELIDADRRAGIVAGQPPPVTAEERKLQGELLALPTRLGTIEDRRTTLAIARARHVAVRIVSPAFVLSDPVAPKPVQAGAGGLMAGLFLAAVVAVALLRPRITG